MNAHDVVKALVDNNIHPNPDGYSANGDLTFTVGIRGGPCWVQVDVSRDAIVATEMTWRVEDDEDGEEGEVIEFEDEADESVDIADIAELIEFLKDLGFGDE